jgi:hypothetical protein
MAMISKEAKGKIWERRIEMIPVHVVLGKNIKNVVGKRML